MRVVGQGRTTLLIAHRLPTASSADRIAVVEDGRIVETGPHDELLAREGRYAELWRAYVETRPLTAGGARAGRDG
jgi:ABC-type multidrug transport system fused ATPase/permease subunit